MMESDLTISKQLPVHKYTKMFNINYNMAQPLEAKTFFFSRLLCLGVTTSSVSPQFIQALDRQ